MAEDKHTATARKALPELPKSWSSLSWQQLCQVWAVKQRYGGNADVARSAALLVLCRLAVSGRQSQPDSVTGETCYVLRSADGEKWKVTARELAYLAKQALPWFDYPYGDPGEPVVKDEKGKVIKEPRDPVIGYVGPMRDAMSLPEETLAIRHGMMTVGTERRRWWQLLPLGRTFALPQVACNNITWEQYRSLQGIVPGLFAEDIAEEQAVKLQAQFLAHILTPRAIALLDTAGGSMRLRPHYEYRYDAAQADGLARWLEKRMTSETRRHNHGKAAAPLSTLFHICFQVYQTTLAYYSASYPLLFSDSGKNDPLRDALTGEVGTINTIMKYAGYSDQKQVYDSNLPFVMDILNTMTKEAKEIERMNAKMKKK